MWMPLDVCLLNDEGQLLYTSSFLSQLHLVYKRLDVWWCICAERVLLFAWWGHFDNSAATRYTRLYYHIAYVIGAYSLCQKLQEGCGCSCGDSLSNAPCVRTFCIHSVHWMGVVVCMRTLCPTTTRPPPPPPPHQQQRAKCQNSWIAAATLTCPKSLDPQATGILCRISEFDPRLWDSIYGW